MNPNKTDVILWSKQQGKEFENIEPYDLSVLDNDKFSMLILAQNRWVIFSL